MIEETQSNVGMFEEIPNGWNGWGDILYILSLDIRKRNQSDDRGDPMVGMFKEISSGALYPHIGVNVPPPNQNTGFRRCLLILDLRFRISRPHNTSLLEKRWRQTKM